MRTNIRYILLTALRDWLFVGLMLGVILATLISSAMGDMAMVEPEQLKRVYAAASSRMVLMVGLIVFACFHVRHSFDTKEIDVFLSRPITRANLVISYWLGFACVALLLVVPTIAIISFTGYHNTSGFALWALSLVLESLLVVASALFSAFTLRSAVTSVIATLGFYVLSRMMGFFLATTHSAFLFQNHTVNEIVRQLMEYLAIFVPRLDFFAKTEWLTYGVQGHHDLILLLLQTGIFIPLLILATILDFRRRQF